MSGLAVVRVVEDTTWDASSHRPLATGSAALVAWALYLVLLRRERARALRRGAAGL